jgi:hypothetical protein
LPRISNALPAVLLRFASATGFSTGIEQVSGTNHVQTFMAEFSVKAFHVSILRWPARLNMVQRDATIYAQRQKNGGTEAVSKEIEKKCSGEIVSTGTVASPGSFVRSF